MAGRAREVAVSRSPAAPPCPAPCRSRSAHGRGADSEVRVDGDRIVDDASLARQWALAGRGITLKSALDVQQDEASGALVRLLPGWDTEPYPLHAVLPSGRFVPARVRALVDFLAAKFAALPSHH
ncbi:hypothetical protein J7E70_19080 [Variovorax paradoxus]|nr:hypothetical protein [Variovorax paradoxus]